MEDELDKRDELNEGLCKLDELKHSNDEFTKFDQLEVDLDIKFELGKLLVR